MKPIKDFPNYCITEDGRIWSNNKNKFISQTLNQKGGYLKVHLYKNGLDYNLYVHRLVAETFIPNPENLPQVNHLNENKLDNRVENLAWCTQQDNLNYGSHNEKANHSRGKPVKCVETGKEYWSASEAHRQTGIAISHICDACNGKLKTSGGFHWEWIKKEKELI